MLNYLFNEIGYIDWGISNLEWIVTLSSYQKNQELLSLILNSPTFTQILKKQHFWHAMDFLEDFIMNNSNIQETTKESLFSRQEMLIYEFMGVLSALNDLPWAKSIGSKLTKADKQLVKDDEEGWMMIHEIRRFAEEENPDCIEELEDVLRLFN